METRNTKSPHAEHEHILSTRTLINAQPSSDIHVTTQPNTSTEATKQKIDYGRLIYQPALTAGVVSIATLIPNYTLTLWQTRPANTPWNAFIKGVVASSATSSSLSVFLSLVKRSYGVSFTKSVFSSHGPTMQNHLLDKLSGDEAIEKPVAQITEQPTTKSKLNGSIILIPGMLAAFGGGAETYMISRSSDKIAREMLENRYAELPKLSAHIKHTVSFKLRAGKAGLNQFSFLMTDAIAEKLYQFLPKEKYGQAPFIFSIFLTGGFAGASNNAFDVVIVNKILNMQNVPGLNRITVPAATEVIADLYKQEGYRVFGRGMIANMGMSAYIYLLLKGTEAVVNKVSETKMVDRAIEQSLRYAQTGLSIFGEWRLKKLKAHLEPQHKPVDEQAKKEAGAPRNSVGR